jgi:hypothetical protein
MSKRERIISVQARADVGTTASEWHVGVFFWPGYEVIYC